MILLREATPDAPGVLEAPAVTRPTYAERLGARLQASYARWPVAWATLLSSVGLLAQSVGYAYGWDGQRVPALLLWYAGFALLVGPFAALLLAPTRTDHQRLGGSLAYTLLLYASWLFSNPVLATRFDETLHVATLVGLTDGRGFFSPNPMLPVSPHFPGLELAAAGAHWLTGAPLMAAQVAVVLVSRVTLVLAVFLLASRIGRSTRVGAITVVLYSASAQFYFFNAQFSYQTLAIALMLAAFYLLVRAFDDPSPRPWRPMLAAQVCLAGLTLTHHVTIVLTLGVLWLLALWFRLAGERRRASLTLVTAEIATVVALAWTAVVAPLLIGYLGPVVSSATDELLQAFVGSGAREVGTSGDGSSAPEWQIVVMAGSIGLWLLLLLPAVWQALRGGTLGRSPARVVLLGVALAYPLLQVGRISSAAAEMADRLSTFVTLAMALVVGAWLVPRLHLVGRLVIPAALVLVLGGTILGSGPDWQRVPGPYLAGAQQRSVDARSVAVAEWAARYLPPGSTVASDFTFARLLPDFGPVVPETFAGGGIDVTPIFVAQSVDQRVVTTLEDSDVDFVLVDERMADQQVRTGAYFEGSGGLGEAGEVFSTQQLTKFDGAPGFDLVLDGPVKVYDVRGLRGEAPVFVDQGPPGLPGTWVPWQLAATGLLALVALLLRGRLLDPRRFRARDLWRPAVLAPVAMALGALGVLSGSSPVAGLVTAGVLVVALVGGSPRPTRLATATPRAATIGWSVAVAVVVGAALAVSLWAAWHGMTDFPPLPPPIGSGLA